VLADRGLVTTHTDGSLHLWDGAGDLRASATQEKPATAVSVDRDSGTVATADADGVIRMWDSGQRDLTPMQSFRTGRGAIVDVAVRGLVVAALDSAGTAGVWATGPATEIRDWQGGGPVWVSPDGTTLAVASGTQAEHGPMLSVVRLDTDAVAATVEPPVGARAISGLATAGQPSAVLVTYQPPTGSPEAGATQVRTVDVDVGAPVGTVSTRAAITDLAATRELVAVAQCDDSHSAWVYRLDDLEDGPSVPVQATRDGDPGACARAVDLATAGDRFAVASEYPHAGTTVYDVDSGRVVTQVEHLPADHAAVRFSPDDRRLLTTGRDETARIWDAKDGALELVLDARAGAVFDARWLPDGTRVVTSHGDGAARVWDATSGTLLTAVGHHSTWPYIDVSPDGRRLVTSADGVARVWTLDPDELLELARARVSRNLSEAECDRYGIETCQST
jgi:WD40 repeat protein